MSHPLVEKYGDARLPRYTSYPTTPVFDAEIGEGRYGQWLQQIAADAKASLYIHVPFCRAMCWYCGCHTTVSRRDPPVLTYLAAVEREAALVAGHLRHPLEVRHIHFGGGTPTVMPPAALRRLMGALIAQFDIGKATELAIEIDPRTLSAEMAATLGEIGTDRASLGIQSFDRKVQIAINRIQSFEQTELAVQRLRDVGVRGINFDLIYGLPHETVESCIATAKAAAALKPDRFAVFGYAHIPSFKKHQRMIDEAVLPGAEERNAQAEAIAQTLREAGYVQIGLDHFALPQDGMAIAASEGRLRRNFQGYAAEPYDVLIGLGASSVGTTSSGYVQNEVAHGLYEQRIAANQLATVKGYRLTADDRFRADLIERVMCDFAVDVGAIAARHGVDPASVLEGNGRLAALAEDGVVAIAGTRVTVRTDFRFLVRAVAASFDAYIDTKARTHSKAA